MSQKKKFSKRLLASLPTPDDMCLARDDDHGRQSRLCLFDSHTHLYSTMQKVFSSFPQLEKDVEAITGDDLTDNDLTWKQKHNRRCLENDFHDFSPLFRNKNYDDSVTTFMQRAHRAGVGFVCTVGDGIDEAELALHAAKIHDRVFAACGVHPTLAHSVDESVRARLLTLACDPRCVAIGETGLDKYWIDHDPATPGLDIQEEVFRWHIDVAVRTGKTLMIHNREADGEIMNILADAPQPKNVILHCFSSPVSVAREAIERGYFLSFAGNSTFKANDFLRQAACLVPADQILIETDAPYMTPEPYRGQRNEPGFLGYTARVLAHARGDSVGEFVETTTANAFRAFGLL